MQVARSLPDAGVLLREMHNFRVKITAAANETFSPWREGDHDDLVLAVAVAVWQGERDGLAEGALPFKLERGPARMRR